MYYRILTFNDEMHKIIIPKHLWNQDSVCFEKVMKVKAGIKLGTAEVTVSKEENDTVRISYAMIKYLSLPTDNLYQIVIENDIIHIGPVIGLLFAHSSRYLTKASLRNCLDYTSHYHLFKGLLCVFSYDGINFEDNTVDGYYYRNSEYNQEAYWKKETLLLPAVIYRRQPLDWEQMDKLRRSGESIIFNSYYFTKWDFWKIVSSSEVLKPHIPDSRLLHSLSDLDDMLQRHGTVYLKLINGSKASGLVQVNKDENYHFTSIDSDYAVEVEKGHPASNYVKNLLNERPYIVQQAVNSINIENRKVDFRVVMQKDEGREWVCKAIIAKVGKVNGISSNFTEGGYALSFENALKKALGLSDKEILSKKQELMDVCLELCRELDTTGENFGDFGVDAAIDENLHIWIFEVNKGQDFSILEHVYSREEYLSIKSNPTRYALGLTPFSIEKN
jgi:hypothetical protein